MVTLRRTEWKTDPFISLTLNLGTFSTNIHRCLQQYCQDEMIHGYRCLHPT